MVRIILGAVFMLGFGFYMMPSDQQLQALESQQNYEKETDTFVKQARIAQSIISDKQVVELSERVKADLERGELNPAWYIMDKLTDRNPDITDATLTASGEMTFINTANDVKVACQHEDHTHHWLTVCMATSLDGEKFFDKAVY